MDLICRSYLGGIPTCLSPGNLKDRCSTNADCDDGLICNHAVSPPMCLRRGKADDGKPERCITHLECERGLSCNLALSPARCSKRFARGGLCKHELDCIEGLRCNRGYSPPRCELPGDLNDICRFARDCISGLACNGSSHPNRCRTATELGAICAFKRMSDDSSECYPDEKLRECRHRLEAWAAYRKCKKDVIKFSNSIADEIGASRECRYLLSHYLGEDLTDSEALRHSNIMQISFMPPDTDSTRGPEIHREPRIQCGESEVCNHSTDPATCMAPGKTGASCLYDSDCIGGLECSWKKCQEANTQGGGSISCSSDADCEPDCVCSFSPGQMYIPSLDPNAPPIPNPMAAGYCSCLALIR